MGRICTLIVIFLAVSTFSAPGGFRKSLIEYYKHPNGYHYRVHKSPYHHTLHHKPQTHYIKPKKVYTFRIIEDVSPKVSIEDILDDTQVETETDTDYDIFGRNDVILPTMDVTKPSKVTTEKSVPVQPIDEILDDEEETLQCSDYFELGFSCVLEKNCASSRPAGIFVKNENLDSIFWDEIFNSAQCTDNGAVCCHNDDIL